MFVFGRKSNLRFSQLSFFVISVSVHIRIINNSYSSFPWTWPCRGEFQARTSMDACPDPSQTGYNDAGEPFLIGGYVGGGW
jgi:hypothetical protein